MINIKIDDKTEITNFGWCVCIYQILEGNFTVLLERLEGSEMAARWAQYSK
jgi:hypothetical protein